MSLSDDGGYGGDGHHGPETGQTRTRLPDSGGDPYGQGRRPRSGLSSRNLITVVGVIVLLLAAIAFANRGGSTSTDSDTAGDSPKNAPGPARPTTPTGTKPVTTKNGGIAAGFPKTEQGAQSAAANYVVALSSDGMYNAARRQEIAKAVYAPSVAAARKNDLDKVYSNASVLGRIGLKPDGTAPKGMTFVSRANPVGTKIESLKGDTAKVSVWFSTLFGLAGAQSQNPVTESWYTNTFDLKWIGGDWKVTNFTQKKGPAPIGRDQAAASAEDMTKAVQGYGGLTYAR
ncbi:hypothetical protein [Streptomyces sp. N2A]|uniref:hypothetical protein n=1 Tax=Streptomyces sp. N2A TaxID=3073936 RepID=UPI00287052DA|nr:hypothetical protein [Streptomyces sp. N2A]